MLDGTAKLPEVMKEQSAVSSELQKSIFGAPPLAGAATQASAGLPKSPATASEGGEAPSQGVKRRRDDEDEADDVAMDEDDEGAAMDVSDEE